MKWLNRLDNKLDPINWPEYMLGYHRDRWLAMATLIVSWFVFTHIAPNAPTVWRLINWIL